MAAIVLGIGVGAILTDRGRGSSGRAAADRGGPSSPASSSSPSPPTTTIEPELTGPSPPTTAPERLTADSRIDVRGIGPIEAGMTLREAERAGGRRLRVTEFDTFGGVCYYAEPEGLAGLSFLVLAPGDTAPSDPHDGVIGRVTASDPRWRTVSGLHVGSTIDDVRQRHPQHLREAPHQYQEGGWYLTFEPQSAQDRPFGVRFEVGDGSSVDLVHGGKADVIAFVEGCA